jgi:hypothetical protein
MSTSVNNAAVLNTEAVIVDADAAKKDDAKGCSHVLVSGRNKGNPCGRPLRRNGGPFCSAHAPKKPSGNDQTLKDLLTLVNQLQTKVEHLEAEAKLEAQDVAQDVVHQVTDLQTKVIAFEATIKALETRQADLEAKFEADLKAELEAQAAKFKTDLEAYKANLKAELEADLKAKKKKSSKKKEEKVETSQPPAVVVEAKPNGDRDDSDDSTAE